MRYIQCEGSLKRRLDNLAHEGIKPELFNAMQEGGIEAIKEFFSIPYDTYSSRRYYIRNITFIAAMHNQFELVNYLITTYKGQIDPSLFHLAMRFGAVDVVNSLILQGADINQRDPRHNDEMAIITAIKAGQLATVSLLIEKGLDLKELEKRADCLPWYELYSESPLHAAAQQGHGIIVEYLVQQGMDISVNENSSTKTTLLHAVAKPVCRETKDSIELVKRKIQLIKYLVQQGVNVHAEDTHGETVLHLAAKYRQFELLKFLLNNTNSEINHPCERGTVLHLALLNSPEDSNQILQFFINKSIDINAVDKYGNTALHQVLDKFFFGYFISSSDTIKRLLLAGANPTIKNHSGVSAYDVFMEKYTKYQKHVAKNPLKNEFMREFQILNVFFSDYSNKSLPKTKKEWKSAFFNVITSSEQKNQLVSFEGSKLSN
ncbi:MAG: ankyrin repeat domain-containing protein [Tatlockia sp.]|jgi:ankyrin repeat protein